MTRGTVQHDLARLRTDYLKPLLREAGFKAQGKRRWWRGTSELGWLIVELLPQRDITQQHGAWQAAVAVWPVGTWEHWTGQDPATGIPFGGISAPVSSTPQLVLGNETDPEAEWISLRTDLTEANVTGEGERIANYLQAAVAWAESLLSSRAADQFMLDSFLLATATATNDWTPERINRLNSLTALAQRAQTKARLVPLIATSRVAAGMPPAPLPSWQHNAMLHGARSERYPSPRAEFEAGIGRALPLVFPDGSERPATAEDLPDNKQIERWLNERVGVPDGVLDHVPDWLPWERWLTPLSRKGSLARRRWPYARRD